MTTTQRVIVNQNNDETIQVTITSHDSIPSDQVFDITGTELDFYIKTSQATPDTDPSTVHLSTTTGEITLPNPSQGIAQVFIARAHLEESGNLWWRLDILSGGQIKTAGNGVLTVSAQ